MGWISDAWDSVCDFASEVVEKVKDVAVKVADVAGNVLVKMAEVGEKVVSTVKSVWKKIKPFIEIVIKKAPVILKVVSLALKRIPHPWAQAIAVILDKGSVIFQKGLAALFGLENSPVLKKIDKALKFILPKMKDFGNSLKSWAEIQKARDLQNELDSLVITPQSQEEKILLLTKILNRFLILKGTVLKLVEEDNIQSMEHYLQLKATEKIFHEFQERISKGLQIEDVTNDDLFMFEVADVLVSQNPELSEDAIVRFDSLVQKMFGMPLLALVFSEMVTFWSSTLEIDVKRQKDLNMELSAKEVIVKRLEKNKKFEIDLDAEELKQLASLKKQIPGIRKEYDVLTKEIMHQQSYIYAAEGMQRALEQNIIEVVETESDASAIEESIPELAELLIGCFRNGVQWEDLSTADQSLIRDFANIFKAASQDRAGKLITVQAVA